MVALRGKEIDSYLARPDPGRPIILLYGPDAGLVRERADALMASAVDDPNDPFSLVRLDGDELAAEPSRLVDEAMTVPLFGGRRAIRVRAGSRNFAAGVDTLAETSIRDCRIVIEAGELRPESPLRKACERAKNAVAIGCYPDTERDLAKLIDDEMKPSDLRLAQDARATLMGLLGGDRQASRNELRKLALYARGKGEVTLDDVMAVVSDASDLKLDPIVDAAFAGNAALVESEFAKAMVAGTYPGVIVAAAQRQAAWLHKSALAVADGTPLSTVLDSGYPRLHFSRKSVVETALRNFTPQRLVGIIDQLAIAALDMRKQTALASAIAQRTLLAIAANAKRRGGSTRPRLPDDGMLRQHLRPEGGGMAQLPKPLASINDFCRLQRPLVRKGPDADHLGRAAHRAVEPGRPRRRNDDNAIGSDAGKMPPRHIPRSLRREMFDQANGKNDIRRLQRRHLLEQIGPVRRRPHRGSLAPLLGEQRETLGVEIDDFVAIDRKRLNQSFEEAAVAAAKLDNAERRFAGRVAPHHGLQPVRRVAPRQMCRRHRALVILVPISRAWRHPAFQTRNHAGTGS